MQKSLSYVLCSKYKVLCVNSKEETALLEYQMNLICILKKPGRNVITVKFPAV